MPFKFHIYGLDEVFEEIEHTFKQFENPESLDLSGFIPIGEKIILKGRKRSLQAGTDVSGKPLEDITKETIKRRRRAGKGQGPPLYPSGPRSSTERHFEYVGDHEPGRVWFLLGWPNAPWVGEHAKGIRYKAGVITRNIQGLDLATLGELTDAFLVYLNQRLLEPGARRSKSSTIKRMKGR